MPKTKKIIFKKDEFGMNAGRVMVSMVGLVTLRKVFPKAKYNILKFKDYGFSKKKRGK